MVVGGRALLVWCGLRRRFMDRCGWRLQRLGCRASAIFLEMKWRSSRRCPPSLTLGLWTAGPARGAIQVDFSQEIAEKLAATLGVVDVDVVLRLQPSNAAWHTVNSRCCLQCPGHVIPRRQPFFARGQPNGCCGHVPACRAGPLRTKDFDCQTRMRRTGQDGSSFKSRTIAPPIWTKMAL